MDHQHDPPRELSTDQRRAILFNNALGPVLLVGFAWVFYISQAAFGFDLMRLFRHRDKPPEMDVEFFYLVASLFITVIAMATIIFRVRRAMHLACHGIAVPTEITSLSAISVYGCVRLDYQYTFRDCVFRKAMTCESGLAKKYRDGIESLIVIVDPSNPHKFMERSQVLPEVKAACESNPWATFGLPDDGEVARG